MIAMEWKGAGALVGILAAVACSSGCPSPKGEESVPAGILVVHPGDSIQAAVDAANDYDVIVVEPGTYLENVTVSDKAIWIRGTAPTDSDVVDATIIDGGAAASVFTILGVEPTAFHSFDVTLQGITLRNGLADQGAGVYAEGTSLRLTLQQVRVHENEALVGGGGLYLKNTRGVIVRESAFTDNTSHGDGGGVLQEDAYASLFDSASIENNVAAGYGGGLSFTRNTVTLPSPLLWGELAVCRILDNTAGLGAGGLDQQTSSVLRNSAIARNVVDATAIAPLTLPSPRPGLAGFGDLGGGVLVTALDPAIDPGATWESNHNIFQFNATASGGGAVALVRTDPAQTVDVEFVTSVVQSNNAGEGGGVWSTDGWLFYDETGAVVADPTDAAAANSFSNNLPDDFYRAPGT